MNETSDQPSASVGRPNSFSTDSKAEAVDEAEEAGEQRTRIARSRGGRLGRAPGVDPAITNRLSVPTTTMLSAMSGSMMLPGGRQDVERRQRERDAVPDRERRDDEARAADAIRRGSSNPMRNSTWSGPIRMCSMPAGMKTPSTAVVPCQLPA